LVAAINTDIGLKYIVNINSRAITTYLSWNSCHIWEPLIYIFECFILIQVAVWCRGKTRRTALVLIVLLMSVELMLHGWNYNTISATDMAFPETPGITMLKSNSEPARCVSIGKFLPNSLAVSGLETIEGYASLYPKNYGSYFNFCKTGKVDDKNISLSRWLNTNNYYSPFYELMNTKYLIFPSDIPLKKSADFEHSFKQVYNKKIVIYENRFAFPRAFGVTGFKVVNNSNKALNEMKGMNYQSLKNNVILHDILEFTNISGTYKEANGIINTKIIDYNTNSMLIYSISSVPGFIVISNNWHPGWKAYVDDKPAKVLKANGFMQAVEVPPGKHEVELLFRPLGVIVGILISLCTWSALIILITVIVIKHLASKYIV
jgi:hypothetical protein